MKDKQFLRFFGFSSSCGEGRDDIPDPVPGKCSFLRFFWFSGLPHSFVIGKVLVMYHAMYHY